MNANDGVGKKVPDTGKSIAATAVVLTIVCAVLGFGLVWIAQSTKGQGASGMVIIFPMIAVVGAHVLMGPVALILALFSRRLWVIIIVFGYFVVGIWSIWTSMSGRSPLQVATTNVTESWSTFIEAREHPAETRLCQSLATRLNAGGRTQPNLQPISLPDVSELDVNFLCRHRKVRLPRTLRNFYRSTPIQLAAVGLELELLKSLIAQGAAVDEPVTEAFTPLLLVLSTSSGFSAHGSMNQRPYVERIRAAAQALLDAGAEINIRESYGAGVLHWAAGTGDPELVQLLLDAGAEVNAGKETSQRTPVYASIETASELNIRFSRYKNIEREEYDRWTAGQKVILEKLIASGAEPEDVLSAAVHLDVRWAIELLLDAGVDIRELLLSHGTGYLQGAMRLDYRELTNYLLTLGINVNQTTARGDRLITEFIMPRHDWQLRALIDAGADVNLPSKRRGTALEIAVKKESKEAVVTLLKSGAIVTEKAINNANLEIGTLLESHGH